MDINGRTRVIAIFGDPIEHTLSPAMHNAAFKYLGLDYAYVAFHVKGRDFKGAAASIKALGMAGANITIPHKVAALKYARPDRLTSLIGAANTIVNEGGRLKAFNTDSPGYVRSLEEETGFSPEGKKIIIAGSGGAARAILFAFAFDRKRRPREIIVAGRTQSRAESLARRARRLFGNGSISSSGLDGLAPKLEDADLLINTTSLGMMEKGELDLPIEVLPRGAVVSDIVYNPLETSLIKRARKLRLAVHPGLGMLIHQGAIGFKLWTGVEAPVEVMRKAALEALKKR